MKSKHTPGPWFIWKERAMQDEGMERDEIAEELLSYEDFSVLAGEPIGEVTRSQVRGCQTIVDISSDLFGDDDDEGCQIALANARLIAAAPDLLKALNKLRNAYLGTCVEVQADAMRYARATIAKAEGGAS